MVSHFFIMSFLVEPGTQGGGFRPISGSGGPPRVLVPVLYPEDSGNLEFIRSIRVLPPAVWESRVCGEERDPLESTLSESAAPVARARRTRRPGALNGLTRRLRKRLSKLARCLGQLWKAPNEAKKPSVFKRLQFVKCKGGGKPAFVEVAKCLSQFRVDRGAKNPRPPFS